ncbi:GNAT family N-acetyltransferase [Comamonas thiooxydans]|uniref:GNAT family N-acetyltransferase n=1 Tax=Comamonas thiooxydans TaxID=363952 RepID=UPI001F525FC1|nr:GNAT family N-acetyltransferase [Comamonas thiooxydans]
MDKRTPMLSAVTIRPLEMNDRTPWCDLYRQYAHFYQSPMTDAILDRSWSWLMDPRHPMEGLVAESEERHLLGLAHFRACPDPLIAQDVGFLDDLFVAQDQRGSGIGRSLIMGVTAKAQERGWPVVRWLTAGSNARARQLYDKLASATDWVNYDLDVQR